MDGAGMEAVADRLAGNTDAAESLGFVPNRNQAVSREQFLRLDRAVGRLSLPSPLHRSPVMEDTVYTASPELRRPRRLRPRQWRICAHRA